MKQIITIIERGGIPGKQFRARSFAIKKGCNVVIDLDAQYREHLVTGTKTSKCRCQPGNPGGGKLHIGKPAEAGEAMFGPYEIINRPTG